ncbi:hypothetical protein HOK51_06345 [Candidatus Woesearchaeota archaeon]|nr:hypothetical protein [Candidatus Woesearchaeota archaeon]MBT6519444.1 hypothetical protein [Candidatus Woesearchaeota archaeon]MBT7368894.1 hypothetical protein [Candidatus Woesearchaeota archaeon]
MKINELQAGQGKIEVELAVVEVSDVREFEKFGKTGRVANAICKDETGQIKISLWNEQIDQVKIGDRIKIENGYVNEWKGELQLSTGKFGTLTVLSGSEPVKENTDEGEHILTQDEKTEEEVGFESGDSPSLEESETDDEKKESDDVDAGGLEVEEEKI